MVNTPPGFSLARFFLLVNFHWLVKNQYEDIEEKTCADISADATGVGRQTVDGSSAEGRKVFVELVSNSPLADWIGKRLESQTGMCGAWLPSQ